MQRREDYNKVLAQPSQRVCQVMIQVERVTKRFGARQQIVAVNNLSFHVSQGEVYGLLGPNGAGKTTTLRMILGLMKPDEGVCGVDGYDVVLQPDLVKSRIGCVTANDGLYPWLTVREILVFFAEIYGVDRRVAAAQIEQLCRTFEMADFIDRRAATLSTGQKQRAVLRADSCTIHPWSCWMSQRAVSTLLGARPYSRIFSI